MKTLKSLKENSDSLVMVVGAAVSISIPFITIALSTTGIS